ncbi:Bardet-Biedl syndrome 1 protein [Phytophthora nicotianae]|uniref:Bardet-Biedl syndrome 1 protein n=1 Tax=Phytophthora nicotianae TaxID=4792 RepID=A0A0W8C0V4_PHYNI|nr:Bardet-Biedl syndrome 1 protein [Phytophthora nicotianae]
MTDDLVHYVAGFLSPPDLMAAIQVSSWWSTVCSSDVIWRRLCVSRWLLPRPERLKRSTGTTSFLELYQFLDHARYLPRGKFTTKHQIVWARGRDEGADVWMTVAHSSNCQVLSTAGTPYIQLRVVVQNLRPQPLMVDLQELEVRMKGGNEGTIFGVGPIANQPRVEAADAARIKQLAPVVLAVNGVDVYPSLTSQLIELKMFDFAVLVVNVVCNGCEFEPDFLESCSALWLPIRRMGRCTSLSTCRCGLIPDSYHRGIIRVPVVDESVIWRHYDLVSNRFMVLNTRSIEDVDQFSNLLGSPVSHFSKRKQDIEKDVVPAADASSKKIAKSPWLSAYHNSVAGIKAGSSCMQLVDVYGDGDAKLVVADGDQRLKMYKGSALHGEQAILGVPSALSYFYSDNNRPRIPAIAVASGPYIFIYRNFRPHYKFTVPSIEMDAQETKLWEALAKCTIEVPDALAQLLTMRGLGIRLSERSRGLLAIDNIEEQAEYVSRFMDDPLIERSCVTCMTSINKNMDDKDAVSCLVVATEGCMVYVLDPQGTSLIQQIKVPGVPVEIVAVGLLEVECRLVITTRNGSVYMIKNGELLKSVIELESPACGLVQLEKSIVIASMSRKLTSYHLKGKKNWSLTMSDDIVALEAFSLRRTKDTRGVLVALRNGEVTLYNEKVKVCTLSTETVLTGMRFGQYGREEASLVLVQKSGALSLKILKRTASLEAISEAAGPPPEQDIPLNIPKKTTLYVEQTQRERDHATEMHRHFQRDLCKLRLTTARAYVKIIKDGQGPVSYSTGAAIRLNAQVQGIGPFFRIKLNVQVPVQIILAENAGTKAVTDITVAFHYDHELYRVQQSLLLIPLVIPNVQYQYAVDVESISELGAADNVSIFVCGKESCVPLVSAVVSMPLSEPEM